MPKAHRLTAGWALLGFILLVFLTSIFGAIFKPGAWYAQLAKPALTPPGWVFTPAWLLLYLMIALAGWLVWKNGPGLKHAALLCWAGQLLLNALWSWVFFGLQNPALAFADIVVLLIIIVSFIRFAYPISRSAALLFIPYALWVGFAVYLNLGIVLLN